jgi:hypothetical protein
METNTKSVAQAFIDAIIDRDIDVDSTDVEPTVVSQDVVTFQMTKGAPSGGPSSDYVEYTVTISARVVHND